jgi:hypothetical protein
MATPYRERYRPDPAAWAPADPFGSRAAMAARAIRPLIAAATALCSLPWHTAGSSAAAPAVFFPLATLARAGARLRRRSTGGSRRRTGAW